MLILYNFTQIQKYFTLALLVLLVTNMMSVNKKIFPPRIDEVGPVLDEAGAQFLFLVLVVTRTLKKQVFYGYPDHKGEEFHPYQPVF